MAATSDYEQQLGETARLVAATAREAPDGWTLVFQSRSGAPHQPWLEPDINDAIASLPDHPLAIIVVPIGFVSDHMEVVYDLDHTAVGTAAQRGIRVLRTPTPGTDPRFVGMILDLVEEAEGQRPPAFLGDLGPAPFPCRPGCCPPPAALSERASRSG
jgi:ferrochelatase